ncbi:NlpC/P60 family [Rubrobacter radiotolerans]|uniref:C40 family peptidase n=1 Tax=Rubrobacter radiotolerans TaxID=42256 RepID=A0A023X3Y4_RUBRA|nr:C40 family peptidase [Rubrobacter radiotolerans]AHY47177.1 NlpC/P60 family [Rubrobacter radiotolerans]MDX5894580.1 C40 family peptidase [Rubrobacter radiotolerans]SMC06310.1 NlpC/P60 family protein [Rubrobacter radiotolerans DSM 5868]
MRGDGRVLVSSGRRAGALFLALLFGLLAAAACALVAARVAGADEVRAGQTAFVDVQAATLWTEPYQARPDVDRPSLSNPTGLTSWASRMTGSQKGWLIGKTQTQALYGEPVRVLDTYGVWARVAVPSQRTPKNRAGYPGWVPMAQLSTQSGTAIGGREFVQVVKKHALLYDDRALSRVDHSVSFGTRLAVTGRAAGKVRVESPKGDDDWMDLRAVEVYTSAAQIRERSKPTPLKVAQRAAMFRGTPYIWGGTSSYGLDCSGFTYQVYRSFGINLPRDAQDQRDAGRAVGGSRVKGDLLFFGPSPSNITHVAMYYGDGKIVHAPYGASRVVVEDLRSSGRMSSYQGTRRYL